MPVTIDPGQINNSNDVKVSTLSDDKQFRINKVQNDLNRTFQEGIIERKAAEYGMGYINLFGYPITSGSLSYFKKGEVEKLRMGCFNFNEKELFIVLSRLRIDGQKEKINLLVEQGYTIKFYYCSEDSIDKIIKTYDLIVENTTVNDDINLNSETMAKFEDQKLSLDNLQQIIDMSDNTTQMMEAMLACAAGNHASDIHLESDGSKYYIKLRLDGVMKTMAFFPVEKQREVENRIKLLSKLKLNINDIPQDGRFSFEYDTMPLDVRVSMLPSQHGYSVVMRILGNNNVQLNLESLGFLEYQRKMLEKALKRNQGLILTTGPTGSGKTTTLYTMLTILNDGMNKIISLEDPIEYRLDGISQTQIDQTKGITFGTALRSVLRQDPDIIMVGEIRDFETADTAVNAALTGHKVLSTLHTNDAVGALPRMLEMGLKGYLFADALSVVIGQRLVRKVCPNCKEPHELAELELEIFTKGYNELKANPTFAALPDIADIKFTHNKGCENCNLSGYKGRLGIYEVFDLNQDLKSMLSDNITSPSDIRENLAKNNFVTMLQDAVYKVIIGETDMAEVIRVVN
jgi:type II secretory ATPase GspE/PulE/Tfp pilus assembly ATPase PilB-like protein